MTISELLHHHGIQVPRYVTVNGRIVFDDVAATSSGYQHKSFGTVTPVANHRFHGGSAEPNDNPVSAQNWWDDAERIAPHVAAIQLSFPSFAYLEADDEMGPCWGGEIDTGRGRFMVLVFLRRDEGLPRVVVLNLRLGVHAGKRWIPAPHLYMNGNLCIASETDWDPAVHTAATAVGWAAHWLAAYTEWRFTRKWPVDGVHAIAA